MLPSANRMRRSADFSSAVRFGQRARRGNIVLHSRLADPAPIGAVTTAMSASPSRVGFVVGKSVGGSVVRHRVSRRLRAILAPRVQSLPAGSDTVVRALPGAATASSAGLAADVDAALQRLSPRSAR